MEEARPAHLLQRLGVVDLTLITIGAVIGSGIFRNPAVVAQRAHVPALIVGCWIAGGFMAMIAAFVFAELAARRPVGGGLYAYLRDAYNPLVAFLLGWTVLAIAYTGSTAASAVLFSGYFLPLLGLHADPRIVAVTAIAAVTLINVLGVRQGSTWQNLLVALKVFGIGGVIVAGSIAHPVLSRAPVFVSLNTPLAWVGAAGVAMLPVLFAYNGFQSATYMTGEARNPGRTIPLGQLLGVAFVVAIYVLVNIACLRVLGQHGLAATKTPAADVMSVAFGPIGAVIIAAAIATSTLGYMSTGVLLAPRLYFQMSADGLFFKQIAWISPRTHVPVIAIVLHGTIAAIIAASGTFEQIVNWVTLPDWLFIMLAAIAIFIFRKREANLPRPAFTVPWHPWSTLLLIAAVVAVGISVIAIYPWDSLYGAIVLATGAAFFYIWKALHASPATAGPEVVP